MLNQYNARRRAAGNSDTFQAERLAQTDMFSLGEKRSSVSFDPRAAARVGYHRDKSRAAAQHLRVEKNERTTGEITLGY